MQPIQLWLPRCVPSLGIPEIGRDAQRAFRAWKGEHRVWLIPWLQEEVQWQEKHGLWVRAIPADHLDYVDVFHIGECGTVFGPRSQVRFPNGRVDGLLSFWLNLHQDHKMGGMVTAEPPTITLRLPEITSQGMRYVEESFDQEPGPCFPMVRFDARCIAIKWPPDGHPRTISPDGESYAFYRSRSPASPIWHLVSHWPGPLEQLAPLGGSFDLLYHQAIMAKVARDSASDPDGALYLAREDAAQYISDGHTTQDWAWLWPTHMRFEMWWNR